MHGELCSCLVLKHFGRVVALDCSATYKCLIFMCIRAKDSASFGGVIL